MSDTARLTRRKFMGVLIVLSLRTTRHTRELPSRLIATMTEQRVITALENAMFVAEIFCSIYRSVPICCCRLKACPLEKDLKVTVLYSSLYTSSYTILPNYTTSSNFFPAASKSIHSKQDKTHPDCFSFFRILAQCNQQKVRQNVSGFSLVSLVFSVRCRP